MALNQGFAEMAMNKQIEATLTIEPFFVYDILASNNVNMIEGNDWFRASLLKRNCEISLTRVYKVRSVLQVANIETVHFTAF